MTAPNGPILYHSPSGSNTQASGLGPSTAVFGTGASTTNGSAVVTGITTTGVTAGDLLWISTSGGRRFSVIASVDSGTQVTCDDNFGVTASGQTWAIGGKRASFNSNIALIDDGGGGGDAKPGWTIQFQSGHTETIGSRIVVRAGGDTTNGPITIQGEPNATTIPVLTFTNNDDFFLVNVNHVQFRDFAAKNSSGTKTSSYIVRLNQDLIGIVCKGLVANDASNAWYSAIGVSGFGFKVTECIIGHCSNSGIRVTNGGGGIDVSSCRIYSCGASGFGFGGNVQVLGLNIHNNLIYDNTADGIEWNNTGDGRSTGTISGNIIHGNGSDGIQITNNNVGIPNIVNNIITGNGAYGINSAASGAARASGAIINVNAFFDNSSGQVVGIANGQDDITLTSDPFVNAASGDFNINDTSGGGALLRAATLEL
jgi:hypothetical protein